MLAVEAGRAVEVGLLLHRHQLDLGEINLLENLAVTSTVCASGNRDVADHPPPHTVAASVEGAPPISLKPRSANVSKKTGRGRNVEKNEACCPFQSLP